ncbi:MAG TPA: hypothetical protein VGP72_00355 [Planctomycetota bacterium]|jgi:hypothetical protein
MEAFLRDKANRLSDTADDKKRDHYELLAMKLASCRKNGFERRDCRCGKIWLCPFCRDRHAWQQARVTRQRTIRAMQHRPAMRAIWLTIAMPPTNDLRFSLHVLLSLAKKTLKRYMDAASWRMEIKELRDGRLVPHVHAVVLVRQRADVERLKQVWAPAVLRRYEREGREIENFKLFSNRAHSTPLHCYENRKCPTPEEIGADAHGCIKYSGKGAIDYERDSVSPAVKLRIHETVAAAGANKELGNKTFGGLLGDFYASSKTQKAAVRHLNIESSKQFNEKLHPKTRRKVIPKRRSSGLLKELKLRPEI